MTRTRWAILQAVFNIPASLYYGFLCGALAALIVIVRGSGFLRPPGPTSTAQVVLRFLVAGTAWFIVLIICCVSAALISAISTALIGFVTGFLTYKTVPEVNPLTEAPGYQAAFYALMDCAELLRKQSPNYERALAILKPFEGCAGFAEVSKEKSDAMMSMLCATFGDCYREAREYNRAATAYERAAGYRQGTGFAEFYAGMVTQHGLTDHYKPALQALLAADALWSRIPVRKRLVGHFVSLWYRWRSGCWLPSQTSERSRLIRELIELVRRMS